MKHTLHQCLALLMALLMLFSTYPLAMAEGESTETVAETVTETIAAADAKDWTVMLYLCGTDLESFNGMATTNLVEISKTIPNEHVNVVIETGGTNFWKAEEPLGIKISSDKLQRWSFGMEGYQLVDEQPLANMADHRTLTEFVKWSAANYPAEKYLLVLWDHGGGSNDGLILDQLHNSSIMSLEDLGTSLTNAGVHMEAILLDACLMASLETAQMLQPHANYLIASEESVPGMGSPFQQWLQYLYDYPYVNGRHFGKIVCDASQQKYAEANQAFYSRMLTFSVIDLTKLDPVVAAFENMFAEIGQLLKDPAAFGRFTYLIQNTDHFDFPEMVDLQDFATRAARYGLKTETVGAVIEAVADAVVHDVKGLLHSYSHGLSFWYKPQAKVGELDHFARNCKNPHYLAFLDATHMSWTAPSWVYEKVERLPDISRQDYIVTKNVQLNSDNHLQLNITNAKEAIARVDYRLFMANENVPNGYITLGMDDDIEGDWEEGTFWDKFDGTWPTIGGIPCQIEMVNGNSNYTLYNVPLGIPHNAEDLSLGYQQMNLRVGFEYNKPLTSVFDAMHPATGKAQPAAEENAEKPAETDPYAGKYVIYGIWNQSNSNIGLASRDVQDLQSMYGKEFTVLAQGLAPVTREKEGEIPMGKFVLTEDVVIEDKPLPAGEYAYQFVITDVFGNESITLPMPFTWDGETITYNYERYDMQLLTYELFGQVF